MGEVEGSEENRDGMMEREETGRSGGYCMVRHTVGEVSAERNVREAKMEWKQGKGKPEGDMEVMYR